MNPKKFISEGEEVFRAREALMTIERSDIEDLKRKAIGNERGRCRICIHAGANDPVHEMFIALRGGAFDRPHAHRGKRESFLMVDGRMAVVLFRADASIDQVIHLHAGGPCSYYHLAVSGLVHATVILETAVFLEITQGPFDPGDSFYPDWSPEYGTPGADAFSYRLRQHLRENIHG
ncbi:MAG: cupin fold metalloprotein, WbuC family [Magnetococcales bacterium]|nr:cupin fold metalloprotein, WbuC family [Magnetococcales bacterium]